MHKSFRLHKGGGLLPGGEPAEVIKRFEKIDTIVYSNEDDGAEYIARLVVDRIRSHTGSRPFVLGLTTGKTSVGVYRKLLSLHRNGEISFSHTAIFGVDEFFPISPDHTRSRNYRIRTELLDEIDILPENIHLPESDMAIEQVAAFCKRYEQTIAHYGGIDLMLLGFGPEGQIGFNEPGSFINSRTRMVVAGNATRKRLSGSFFGFEYTPHRAITMGIGTILESREIVCMAWGEEKAAIVQEIVEGDIKASVPASALQLHSNLRMLLDESSAEDLTRFKTPWLVGTCIWDSKFIRKAVLWLCEKVDKPILKLTYQDYSDNNLAQLLEAAGSYDKINIDVFNDLQHTITGWPGGKPNADDSTRPETADPFPKTILIFSPHPDDDVISMGGTFLRLVDQGHNVHVAYQTSGNIAVNDDVVLQTLDTVRECGFGDHLEEFVETIRSKQTGEPEPMNLRTVKGAIRRAEARAACRHFGLDPDTNAHFLDMPFYETGGIEKSDLGKEDIDIIVNLLRQLKPHRIFAAGDLTDPHGTHRICIEAVLEAVKAVEDDEWFEGCRLWLYRGAWQEWPLDLVDMAVPLSPEEVMKKRHAIYRHLSQKDIVPFPGEDKREFWQRAEERTENTAKKYDELGMAEYQAIEVFVRLF